MGQVGGRSHRGPAGVVDQHVDAAPGACRSRHHAAGSGRVRDVGGDRQRFDADRPQSIRCRVCPPGVPAVDDHPRSAAPELLGAGVADAAAGASDDHHPAGEIAHGGTS